MAQIINGQVTFQGGEALPQVGSEAYKQVQSGIVPTANYNVNSTPTPISSNPVNPIIDAGSIGNKNPITLPTQNKTVSTTNPTVPTPTGTVLDSNGIATLPVVDKTMATDKQTLKDKLFKSIGILDTKPQVTLDLQKEQQLAEKTLQATNDYNTYIKAKNDLTQKVESMKTAEANVNGAVGGGYSSSIADFERKGNANLANLAIQAQASQGLLSATQQTIKDKLDAQFQPIMDNISAYSTFTQINNNDLTDSEKFALQKIKDQKEKEATATMKVANDLHQNVINNGNPSGVLEALDKVTSDYNNGLITATEAQSKYYKVAGKYGSDKVNNSTSSTGILSTLPTSIQGKVINIANDFGSKPSIKKYIEAVDSVNIINGIDSKSTNPADHQQVVYAFAKALDPDSAVKGEEYNTIKKYAQSTISKYGKEITNAINGTGFLSEEAISNIKKTMNNTLDSRKSVYQNTLNETKRVINGIAGKNVADEIIVNYSGGISNNQTGNNIDYTSTLDSIFK